MGRPKGSKNKKTLEKLAANTVDVIEATQEPKPKVVKPTDKPTTEPPAKKVSVSKATTSPTIKENIPKILEMAESIYKSLTPAQQVKWNKGVGKEDPHYKTPAHRIADLMVTYFELGVSNEDHITLFLNEEKGHIRATP